jgi:prepilin-type N-terminal cleavage/methylation domain-containing protein
MERWDRRRRGGKRGFTLIELLIVMVILAILAGIVIISVGGVIGRGQETAYNGAKEQVEAAVTDYIARTYGFIPETGDNVTIGNVTYDIIDICPLLHTYTGSEGPGLLTEVPYSVVEDAAIANTNVDNCAGNGSATAHYMWLLDPNEDVESQCKNTAANSGGCTVDDAIGFQDVYP